MMMEWGKEKENTCTYVYTQRKQNIMTKSNQTQNVNTYRNCTSIFNRIRSVSLSLFSLFFFFYLFLSFTLPQFTPRTTLNPPSRFSRLIVLPTVLFYTLLFMFLPDNPRVFIFYIFPPLSCFISHVFIFFIDIFLKI